MKTDQDTTVQQLKNDVEAFLEARGWHNGEPRGLAISIALEASELLEHFQWREHKPEDLPEIANELADVIICAVNLATTLHIDVATACREKLAKQAVKYPTEVFYPGVHNREAYKKIKQAYRAKKKS